MSRRIPEALASLFDPRFAIPARNPEYGGSNERRGDSVSEARRILSAQKSHEAACTMVLAACQREPMPTRRTKKIDPLVDVERVQTGVRLEKNLLKVLKAVAELMEMSLGDLLEGIVLHAFEGKSPFSPETLKSIEQFKSLYGMTLRSQDSHKLKERR